MNGKIKDIDITKNLKTIEWLKAELVDSVAALLKALLKTGNDMIADAVANIIIIAYLLGRRVGLNLHAIDAQIKNKLQTSIDESQEIGQWYGDLADLLNYLENKKR
ncbi:MAG: MazG-like family protein [Syntrophomonadaceae bacterium]|nr:MazG-like family protein [Syntrophomonadaceae bacterium]